MDNCITDKLGDKIHFCGIPRIEKTRLAAEKAADRFKKMFQQNQ